MEVAHEFPPFTTPTGAVVTEVLVNGACKWEKQNDGKWNCVPKKGGDCDRKEWTDDGCRVKLYIFGKANRFTVIKKCMCQNSMEDALTE